MSESHRSLTETIRYNQKDIMFANSTEKMHTLIDIIERFDSIYDGLELLNERMIAIVVFINVFVEPDKNKVLFDT
jgi:hypothetical protein